MALEINKKNIIDQCNKWPRYMKIPLFAQQLLSNYNVVDKEGLGTDKHCCPQGA